MFCRLDGEEEEFEDVPLVSGKIYVGCQLEVKQDT